MKQFRNHLAALLAVAAIASLSGLPASTGAGEAPSSADQPAPMVVLASCCEDDDREEDEPDPPSLVARTLGA